MATLLSKANYETIQSRLISIRKTRARKMRNRLQALETGFHPGCTPAQILRAHLVWPIFRKVSYNPETDQC